MAAKYRLDQGKGVEWLESQPVDGQQGLAESTFKDLLRDASQPKETAGNACVKLCRLVDGCARSDSAELRAWSASEATIDTLFTFYIESDGSDHHRAMRQLLDIIVQQLGRRPDAASARAARQRMLTLVVSIVTGTNTKPVAKAALKTLDYFLVKKVVGLDELETTFRACQRPSDDDKASAKPERSGTAQQQQQELWRGIFTDVFHWMSFYVVSQATGKLLGTLYRILRSRGGEEPGLDIGTWLKWLAASIEEDPSLLEVTTRYLFLPLFKADHVEAVKMLRVVLEQDTSAADEDDDASLNVFALLRLSILESGKKIGMVEEPGPRLPSKKVHSIMLDEGIVSSVLCHPSRDVRGLALSLLVTSPSSTKPYSPAALDLLRQHLAPFLADPDPKFRGDVMSRIREMFKRVRGAICLLKRSLAKVKAKAEKSDKPKQHSVNVLDLPETDLEKTLGDHEEFLFWLIGFLRDELVPTASYQRHFASLRALSFILYMEADNSKDWGTSDDQRLFYDLFDGTWTRALFDLIMDPFEDVRDLSAASIKSLASDERFRRFSLRDGQSSIADEIAQLAQRADDLARRTSRADHSDGAARACQVLYQVAGSNEDRVKLFGNLVGGLERKVLMASRDLGAAVLEAPLHGDFAALSYVWQVVSDTEYHSGEVQALRGLLERIVACCEQVWGAVRGILCDDSPEGHLPQELEEQDGLNTKDLLSYSFRAVHESSNLMRHVILSIRNRTKSKAAGEQGMHVFPSEDSFVRIGELSFLQLSTLRHRGAFSTVSQTFSTCCQQCQHLDARGDELLAGWYEGTMAAIAAQASTTRRSAGIPSLMTGILSANAARPAFEQVMEELMTVASGEARVQETDGSRLPQVHAFNCLKDIFKSAFLTANGNKSDRYLPRCLELAATALRSEVWAIRNCGLLLLRSLIDCFLGNNYNKAMIEAGWDGKANRISYHRYQTLPLILLNLLRSGRGAESVFPALDIIRRAGPPDALRTELEAHIREYLGSPVWLVREMAARTLCSCLLHDGWLEAIKTLLEGTAAMVGREQLSVSLNRVHGVLLAVRFVIERHAEVAPARLQAKLPLLAEALQQASLQSKFGFCPEIQAAHLSVLNAILACQLGHTATAHGDNRNNNKARHVLSSSSLSPMPISPPSGGSALLNIQFILSNLYPLSLDPKPRDGLRQALVGHVNAVVPALELLPKLFDPSSSRTLDETLADVCSFHADFILSSPAGDGHPQAVALENLAGFLDHLVARRGRLDLVGDLPLQKLWAHLPPQSMGPALAQATMRASGCIVGILYRMGAVSGSAAGITPDGLRAWGLLMAEGGHDDRDFDTRFAAASSLRSFFAIHGPPRAEREDDCLLAPLMALYDVLNDDDDEIRHVGSAAARSLLGRMLVPVEAADALLQWLTITFADSPTFRFIVASRVAGFYGRRDVTTTTTTTTIGHSDDWARAGEQLTTALAFDDSLFVIEENNLFMDEVREARRWSRVLRQLPWSPTDEFLLKLDRWLAEGLIALRKLMEADGDGPLGWASTPEVFALCARLILGSTAMVSMDLAGEEHAAAHYGIQELPIVKGVRDKDVLSGFLLRMLDSRTVAQE